jgi:hypothetical protein
VDVATATCRPVNRGVVDYYQFTIFGEVNVQLHLIDAQRKGSLERSYRVLWFKACYTSMTSHKYQYRFLSP